MEERIEEGRVLSAKVRGRSVGRSVGRKIINNNDTINQYNACGITTILWKGICRMMSLTDRHNSGVVMIV